jgi:hypothetical protein
MYKVNVDGCFKKLELGNFCCLEWADSSPRSLGCADGIRDWTHDLLA